VGRPRRDSGGPARHGRDLERPGQAPAQLRDRQLRGLLLLLVFALGVVATTTLASLAVLLRHSLAFTLANLVASAALNTGLFLLAFRVLTPHRIPTRQLPLGAGVAGILWVLLQSVGGYLVGHNLKHASQVYGFFAIVLVMLSWLYLAAQATLYAAEVNVVRARRLWPRSILQPPLTRSDRQALAALPRADRQQRGRGRSTLAWTEAVGNERCHLMLQS
jgi:uncharacterized BrkB/YihY/UPF0761 family membrane protein